MLKLLKILSGLLLIKGISETIQNEVKEQKEDFSVRYWVH